MRFRSRPVEVEAIQWRADNLDDVLAFVGGSRGRPNFQRWQQFGETVWSLWVGKSERWCPVASQDWIIREPDQTGFYPCASHVFAERWELIE